MLRRANCTPHYYNSQDKACLRPFAVRLR